MRIGVDITPDHLRAVVLDAGSVIWAEEIDRPCAPADGCRRLIRRLDPVLRAGLSGATVAIAPGRSDLRLERIGLIRISPPSAAALGPLSGWPVELAAGMTGRVRIVPGGATFLGTDAVHPDPDEIATAAGELADAGAEHIVIAASGALAVPEVERRAQRAARRGAPSARVTLSHELGGLGLRERESSAVLEAGLGDWSKQLAGEIREAFAPLPVSFARGLGSRVDSAYFAAHPLGAIDARRRCAVEGSVLLADDGDLVVVFTDRDEVVVIGVSDFRIERQDVAEIWGVPYNHQPFEAGVHPRANQKAWESDAAQAALRRPGHAVVVVGDGPPERMMTNGAMAVAVGAARADIVVETERIVTAGPERMDAELAAIIEDARSRAVLAGAGPADELVIVVETAPISYVPEGTSSVRVTARSTGA